MQDKYSIFTSKMKLNNEEIKARALLLIKNHVDEPEETFITKLEPPAAALWKKTNELKSQYKDLMTNPNWKQIEKKDTYTSYSMPGEEGMIYIKSEGIIDCSPLEVIAFINFHERKSMYDLNYKTGKCLKSYPNNIDIMYERFNGKLIFSDRDFVFVSSKYFNISDGTIQSIATDALDIMKEESGAVRASLKLGGYFLQPEGDKTKAVYINSSNLKGNIPGFFSNSVAENQGSLVSRINEAIKKFCIEKK